MNKRSILTFRWGVLLLVLFCLSYFPSVEGPGIEAPEPIGAYLNGIFPDEAPNSMGGSASYSIENAFPGVTFTDPIDVEELPNGQLMLIGKPGFVWVFDNDPNLMPSDVVKVLDISTNTLLGGDSGLLGLAIHPDFANNGYFYVWYRYSPNKNEGNNSGSNKDGYMRLERFTLTYNNGQPEVNTPIDNHVLIQQYDTHDWHNGGDMFFGPDGFLYLSIGDEGGANDQFNTTQMIDKWLFGGVLRIDVDMQGGNISHPIVNQPINPSSPPSGWPNSYTQNYYIPDDNPWIGYSSGVLEEFFSIGTRSPHRMTYDPVGDSIWIGDIGQGSREEISVIHRSQVLNGSNGANLQWPYREGSINGPKSKPNPLIGFDNPPIYDYPRDIGRCVIGGFVYRGDLYPELKGKYLFSDHETQNIWTLQQNPNGAPPTVEFLLNVPVEGQGSKDGISSFGILSDGTILISDLYGSGQDGGKIHKLVRNDGSVSEPPEKLSDLGVFTDLNTLNPIPGLIPYDVNAPLWSDRALKYRWIAIPNDGTHNSLGEQIIFEKEENWQFPSGTVAVKHFELPTDENDPNQTVRLETRFLIFDKHGGAYGITYRWNDEETEAFLLTNDETRDIVVTKVGGAQETQTWQFPNRQQCMDCHKKVAGFGLGLKTRQLNLDYTYPSGITANQLETWGHLGIFNQEIEHPNLYPRNTNILNLEASTEFKVRSYLDGNCAYCHRPNGVNGVFDARGLIPLHEQKLINTGPKSTAYPIGLIVHPNNLSNSLLWTRDNSLAPDAMPPLAKNLVDEDYIQELTTWVNGLETVAPEKINERWYYLKARHSGKVLTVKNGYTYEMAAIIQETENNSDQQKWFARGVGGGKYVFVNLKSDLLLTIENMAANQGEQLVQQSYTGNQNQEWYFKKIDNNYFQILSVYNGLSLAILNGNSDDGVQTITALPDENQFEQQFELVSLSGQSIVFDEVTCNSDYLSDLSWSGTPTNGWGPPELDRSNGEQGASDGNTITINGKTYTKGIGAHANSEIIYQLDAQYQTFSAEIGVDDETCSTGSVQFQIYADGILHYQSPVLTQADDAIPITVNIEGVNELRLVINDGENGIGCDHGDWADAKVEYCEPTFCIDANSIEEIIPKCRYTLKFVDSENTATGRNGEDAFDNDNNTIWHTAFTGVDPDPGPPHEIQLDLNGIYSVSKIKYLPRQDGSPNGMIGSYEVYLSLDGSNWGNAVASGTWPNSLAQKEADFAPKQARFIRLVALQEVNNNPWTSAAEIEVIAEWCPGNKEIIGEQGLVSVNEVWKTVSFQNTYTNPVVIVGSLSYNGADRSTQRVRNVTGTSFEVAVEEWDCLDQGHTFEDAFYVVIEAGTYKLLDGSTLIAGNDMVGDSWKEINFPKTFTNDPTIFTQCTSVNESDRVVTRIDHNQTNQNKFRVRLQEGRDGPTDHGLESLAWIALEPGTSNGVLSYESSKTGALIDHNWQKINFDQCYTNPVFICKLSSYYGPDPTGLRFRNLTGQDVEVFAEESSCPSGSNTNHAAEDIHYWVFNEPGNIYGSYMTLTHGKIYLQGPWNGTDMNTSLVDDGLIPLAQPYNTAPWNYKGNECVTSIPPNAVDWVLVQIRHSEDHEKVMAQRACFVNKDGMLIDLDGTEGIFFGRVDLTSCYLSVHHRNHLGVMTGQAVDLR